MNAFQWVFGGFCLFQVCCAASRLRKSRQLSHVFFTAAWLVAFGALMKPELSMWLAERLGIGRGADLVLYILTLLFIWAHSQHYVKRKQLEAQITLLVRELAIHEAQHDAGGAVSPATDVPQPRESPS